MQRKLSNTAEVKFFKLDYEKILKHLKNYARRLAKDNVKAIILIGSLAKGNYTAFSDADIIIIVEKSSERPIDRISKYIDPNLPIDVEPRVYTIEEIVKIAKEGRKIVEEILNGIILAGEKRVLNLIKKHYNTRKFNKSL